MTLCRCGCPYLRHDEPGGCHDCRCPEFRILTTPDALTLSGTTDIDDDDYRLRERGRLMTTPLENLTRRLKRSPLAELLAEHAPYLSRRSDNKLCLRCLDTGGHGEFDTIDDWAAHVAAALTEAGWKKRR